MPGAFFSEKLISNQLSLEDSIDGNLLMKIFINTNQKSHLIKIILFILVILSRIKSHLTSMALQIPIIYI